MEPSYATFFLCAVYVQYCYSWNRYRHSIGASNTLSSTTHAVYIAIMLQGILQPHPYLSATNTPACIPYCMAVMLFRLFDALMQAATNASYPMGRIATAQEVAEAAVWLCTKPGFMTGQTLVLDGGSLA